RVRDVYAVLEVADSSLWYDRGKKLEIYAESGIPEYWIVDVAKQGIQMYAQPHGRRYGSYRLALRGASVTFAAFPDVEFAVDELLG
ncbi:MAG TPA: Uma2 family endonuclease, partial [Xanthomonadales bacterium]|nr:Uma2 family endonuclease [Xanthomonadales bacterium]